MANSKTGKKITSIIGVIAEDNSDVAVLRSLIRKLTSSPFRVEFAVAHGCGRIVGKCRAWAQNLSDRGCQYLLLVRDLDLEELDRLRIELRNALDPTPISPHLIVIPVREIEAWLLADDEAIKKAMKLKKKVKRVSNPETILRPKEYLGNIISMISDKKIRYLNAIHNEKIAEQCAVINLGRCDSFIPFAEFIEKHIK
jgi:hypothetical protein